MILENRHAWPLSNFGSPLHPNLPWLLRARRTSQYWICRVWLLPGSALDETWAQLWSYQLWSYMELRDATVLHSPHGTHLLSNHFLLRCCCVFHGLNMIKSSFDTQFDTQSDVLRGAYRFDDHRKIEEPKEGGLLRLQQGPWTSGQQSQLRVLLKMDFTWFSQLAGFDNWILIRFSMI